MNNTFAIKKKEMRPFTFFYWLHIWNEPTWFVYERARSFILHGFNKGDRLSLSNFNVPISPLNFDIKWKKFFCKFGSMCSWLDSDF